MASAGTSHPQPFGAGQRNGGMLTVSEPGSDDPVELARGLNVFHRLGGLGRGSAKHFRQLCCLAGLHNPNRAVHSTVNPLCERNGQVWIHLSGSFAAQILRSRVEPYWRLSKVSDVNHYFGGAIP